MEGKIADAGNLTLLGVLFNTTAKPTSFSVQLLTDAVATAHSDVVGTHTVASGAGYPGHQTITNNATVSSVGDLPTAVWGLVDFVFTEAHVAITGYQVVMGTDLLFVEKLTTPYTPGGAGATVTIRPRFVLGNGIPSPH